MRITVAQTRPVKGAVEANVIHHKRLIALAVEQGAQVLVFPELSITGYEPELAKELATPPDDPEGRFDDFQLISNGSKITLGIGAPMQGEDGNLIGMLLFEPNKPRRVYNKRYLHADELPYFTAGEEQLFLNEGQEKIALSICYELSVPEHAAYAHDNGAQVYVSSVAKSAAGAVKAIETLMGTAGKYGMAILFSNCVGHCDNFDCGGGTAVISKEGRLLAQLNDTDEGVLILDTDTQAVVEKIL
ncbi:MAG TPA: carbon-nitrogen hydrolase family protein [Puia sp.]|nr:carbon-nitrogen hydrolase family protein [Puia sp.]